MWSVRGFGQAWHWLREKKRAECTPLNAYLTYVTLSWTSILQGQYLEEVLVFSFSKAVVVQSYSILYRLIYLLCVDVHADKTKY